MSAPFEADALVAVLEQAAELARRELKGDLDVVRKADRSPVTRVDRAVDDFLRRELPALAPGSGWLSEETEDDGSRRSAPSVWIVDPIDGTEQLAAGIPEIAISIGWVVCGQVRAAAVINPMTAERGCWVAGAEPEFSGLRPAAAPRSLEESEALVSRTESRAGELARLGGVVGRRRAVGSAAYKLLRVAARADVLTFSLRPKAEWDVCGGVGLILASGLAYARLDGLPVRFNQDVPKIPSGAVAGPSPLALKLRERILRALREPPA